MKKTILTYLDKNTSAAPLAVFRIGFGVMMFYSIIRFAAHGWINSLYIEPQFHFSYFGFEWAKPLGTFTYLLFTICGLTAFFIAIGFKYRLSIILFFLSFTYIELMDKTTYLNHYYFISLLSFLMIFLPANRYFSLDYNKTKTNNLTTPSIPQWSIDSIKLLLSIVYFYAGLAKINSDWLLKAMPLKIWLPSKYDLPFLGNIMQQEWVHYAFSWTGMIYDLLIPFLLLYKKTRLWAFIAVIIFHVLTRVLFPIGMFPFIMIVSALVFFDSKLHENIIAFLKKQLSPLSFLLTPLSRKRTGHTPYEIKFKNIIIPVLVIFFTFQLLFPWRYLTYPGELFWTEEGYRFSWRVMLMEKMGNAQFKIVDASGQSFYIQNDDFLTSFQEKQMSFQPDFILEYAHFLGDHYSAQGYKNVQVYVDCYAALNGRTSRRLIDPTTDLYQIKDSFQHKDWILPLEDEIKGL
ncbi:HTTM domain-containing protein [Nonlabens arenilitoris]|uniref:HTTM domain-containing protein n=1 Tax=Nonlabens arenilitoris TaxID=1217969 RepID=A0A2S7UD01_9FLAO|nr:HTTM domain-containing protein [Nonlabens arenilitoris]PQJ32153.1 HTTM domain-containing protein [Nonlabens arenilitoris]